MTDYKMTDEWRKLLTEKLLGECWHEWELTRRGNHKCKHCGYISFRDFFPSQRSFTTDTDMLVVFRKIRDVGKWKEFHDYIGDKFVLTIPIACICYHCAEFSEWLFLDNPERACCLVADFLEEQAWLKEKENENSRT